MNKIIAFTTIAFASSSDPHPYGLITREKCGERFAENQLVYVIPFEDNEDTLECFLPETLKKAYLEGSERPELKPEKMDDLFMRIIKPTLDNTTAEEFHQTNGNKFIQNMRNPNWDWDMDWNERIKTNEFPVNYETFETIDPSMCKNQSTLLFEEEIKDMPSGTVLSIIPVFTSTGFNREFHCFSKSEINHIRTLSSGDAKNPYVTGEILYQENQYMKAILVNDDVLSSIPNAFDIDYCTEQKCPLTGHELVNLSMISVVKREQTADYDCFETVALEQLLLKPEMNLTEDDWRPILTGVAGETNVKNPITQQPFPQSVSQAIDFNPFRRRVALRSVDHSEHQENGDITLHEELLRRVRQQHQARVEEIQRDLPQKPQLKFHLNGDQDVNISIMVVFGGTDEPAFGNQDTKFECPNRNESAEVTIFHSNDVKCDVGQNYFPSIDVDTDVDIHCTKIRGERNHNIGNETENHAENFRTPVMLFAPENPPQVHTNNNIVTPENINTIPPQVHTNNNIVTPENINTIPPQVHTNNNVTSANNQPSTSNTSPNAHNTHTDNELVKSSKTVSSGMSKKNIILVSCLAACIFICVVVILVVGIWKCGSNGTHAGAAHEPSQQQIQTAEEAEDVYPEEQLI